MARLLHDCAGMPMQFAAWIGAECAQAEAHVRRMLNAIADVPSSITTVVPFAAGAFGVTMRPDRPQALVQPIVCAATGSALALTGVATLPAGNSVVATLNRALASLDVDDAARELATLDGAFVAVLYHAPVAQLLIVSDLLGAHPVYMHHAGERIALATAIRAFAAAGVDVEPDPAGWGAFVGAKHFLGADTSLAGVRQIAPAAVTTYDVRANSLTSHQWWQWPTPDRSVAIDDVDTGEVVDAIAESSARYLALGTSSVLLLSGGFESRLLAGILASLGDRPLALSVANPYEHHEIEARFAAAVARAVGLRIERADPPADFFDTPAFAEYVRASEVANTSVNLFITQVDAELLARNAASVWDGVVFGVSLKDFSLPDRRAWTADYLDANAQTWRAAALVFAPAYVALMREALEATAARELVRYPDSPEGDAQFFIMNRARRRAFQNPLKIFGRHALPFMPGLTRRCLELTWRLGVREKRDAVLYRRILAWHFPELAAIPFCSHGELLPGSRRDASYRLLAYRSALVQHPRIGDLLRRIGATPDRREPTPVARALADVSLDTPFLNRDGIRRLRAEGRTRDPVRTAARELVFYWDAWQRMMAAAQETANAPLVRYDGAGPGAPLAHAWSAYDKGEAVVSAGRDDRRSPDLRE